MISSNVLARSIWRLTHKGLGRVSLAAMVAVVGGAWVASPAGAQRWADAALEERPTGKNLEPFDADGPLLAVVSLGRQKITVWDRNGVVAASPVSTGRKGYETPEGIFSILERKEEHFSNLYDDAAMPFMQRLTWSGVALHAGVVPNYRASHGCIRLPEDFAERLFRTTRLNTRVVIVPHDATPLPIAHRTLFQPGRALAPQSQFRPQSQLPAGGSAAPAHPAPALPGAGSTGDEQPMMLGAAGGPPDPAAPSAGETATDPMLAIEKAREALLARQAMAANRLALATEAVNAAKVGVRPRLLEQGRSEKALRQHVALARRAEGRAEVAAREVEAASTEAEREGAEAAHLEALLALAEARGREAAAREVALEKAAAAEKVQEAVRKLEAERIAALGQHRRISRQLQPVSIFVSRLAGRLYVRQAMQIVTEVPVTLADAEQRIGTHIFTALESGERKGAITWVGLTVETPSGSAPVVARSEPRKPRKGRKGEAAAASGPPPDPLLTARAALDRLEIPADVLVRIMPGLQPGATLIISDLGHSIETGPGTDHVVQTRGEEQAAANIAKFVSRKRVEAQPFAEYRPSRQRRSSTGYLRSGGWDRW